MIYLKEVDEDNYGSGLHVAENQKKFVADVTIFLARAFIHHNFRPRAYTICDNEEAVGMVLYFDNDHQNAYSLDQLFIDERYQSRGYGTAALELVLQEMRRDGKYHKVSLSYVEGDNSAKRLYEKFGFLETVQNWDEISMELVL